MQALQDRQELAPDLLYLWRAFQELHESRDTSMGVAPIFNSEICAWLDLHGITDPWTRLDVYTAVRAMDAVWRKKMHDKQASNG